MRGTLGWKALVVACVALIGLLFAATALTARGTTLRAGPQTQLLGLIDDLQAITDTQAETLAGLTAESEAALARLADTDATIAQAQERAGAGALSAGLVELSGAGIRIVLDDAPRGPGGDLPAGARPDDVVIHQSDIQAVVNALWAAGVDGIAIMGQRIIATSAVLCVGNTLRLQGRTYSPPYTIEAIGEPRRVAETLADSDGVALLEEAVRLFGLEFAVSEEQVRLPAYDGPLALQYAEGA